MTITRLFLTLIARLRAQAQLRWAGRGRRSVRWGSAPVFWRGRIGLAGRGSLTFGDRVKAYGAPLPARITTGPDGSVVIGNGVLINYGVEIYSAQSVQIGEGCDIADLVAIYDTDFHQVEEGAPIRIAPVRIGTNVWIGRGAIVLAGVTIGDHAVVAAGSVVTTDVPARSLIAGNPARVRRELRASDSWFRG